MTKDEDLIERFLRSNTIVVVILSSITSALVSAYITANYRDFEFSRLDWGDAMTFVLVALISLFLAGIAIALLYCGAQLLFFLLETIAEPYRILLHTFFHYKLEDPEVDNPLIKLSSFFRKNKSFLRFGISSGFLLTYIIFVIKTTGYFKFGDLIAILVLGPAIIMNLKKGIAKR